MKSAPPVVFPAGRSLLGPLGVALLLPLSCWMWLPWLTGTASPQHGLLTAILQGVLVLIVVSLLRAQPAKLRALRWDGAQWLAQLTDDGWLPVRITVHADGGGWLWLSVRGESTTQRAAGRCVWPGFPVPPGDRAPAWWILCRRRTNPVRWHGFRCAVYCRSPKAAPQPLTTSGDPI